MKILTIFTPTYNRACTLNRLYDSLLEQTCKNFEWLIVDDGSTDITKDLIQNWIDEKKIPIRYIYQENGGKMCAHNKGVLNTQTELFLCVDSDDYLLSNAVEVITFLWHKHKHLDFLVGIVGYKGVNLNEPMINHFQVFEEYSTCTKLYKDGFRGETTLVFRSEILKNYLFPEIVGEKFITECYIYDKIDQKYKYVVLPKVLTICEYLNDGYSKNSIILLRDNPKGWMLYYNQKAKYSKALKSKMHSICQYICYAILSNSKNIVKNATYKFLAFLFLPLGYMLSVKRKKQYKNIMRDEKI